MAFSRLTSNEPRLEGSAGAVDDAVARVARVDLADTALTADRVGVGDSSAVYSCASGGTAATRLELGSKVDTLVGSLTLETGDGARVQVGGAVGFVGGRKREGGLGLLGERSSTRPTVVAARRLGWATDAVVPVPANTLGRGAVGTVWETLALTDIVVPAVGAVAVRAGTGRGVDFGAAA